MKSKEQLLQYVKQGMKRRQVNQTGMNKNSSRSHAVLNIFLEQIWVEKKKASGGDQQQSTGEASAKAEQDGAADVVKKRHYRKALLTIVDLAGSERLNKTGSESMRLQEAKNINKSIAALGNCIALLAQSSEKSMGQMTSFSHIPFRDSKVTRLLSESLSGNCKTTICACISPSLVHYEETYSTLLFASRAMNVRTEAQRNEKIDLKYQRKAGPQQVYGNYPYGAPAGLHTSSSHDTVLPHGSIEQGERQYLESNFVQSQSEIQLRKQYTQLEEEAKGLRKEVKVLKERIGLGLGGLESQSASNLGQGHHHNNMLAYAPRDDVQSQATYSPYHIDRGSSTGWLANTGSASLVGNPGTHHQQTSPMTLISPYSQSNLTDYGNPHPISKNQSGQFMQQPTQSQTMASQSQGAFASHQQLAQTSSLAMASAASIAQLPPDQQLHASQLLLAQKDQVIQRQSSQIKELTQLLQAMQANMVRYEISQLQR